METVCSIWKKWKKSSINISRWLLIPAVCFYELVFHYWIIGNFSAAQFFNMAGFSICLGGLLSIISSLLPRKASKWFSGICCFLCIVVIMVEYIAGNAYNYFMHPSRILTGATGVLTDYTEVVISMTLANWWRILLVLIPVLMIALSGKSRRRYRNIRGLLFALVFTLSGLGLGFCGMALFSGGLKGYTAQYDFNASVKEHGLITSIFTELSGIGNRSDSLTLELMSYDPLPATEPTDTTEATEATEDTEHIEETEPLPREPMPHVIKGIDFSQLATQTNDGNIRKLCEYIAAQEPEMENEYTGLFRGKNLIFITAESFNHKVIDPVLTPTLYRLATKGIEFTNYYEPLWTGCTSGGELVNLSGLAMNCEMIIYSSQKPFNTIGRQLMNEGYFSRAYHNNIYTYYDRDKTHTNLGYEKFIAMGTGMQKGVKEVWPESDEDMFLYTMEEYIDQRPFSIYYMTVSAHPRYTQGGNAMVRKNWDLVKDLPYSDAVKSYLASNMEVEKALTALVDRLEKEGIADDTVIVLAADHYPYGLGTSWGFSHDGLAELYGVNKYNMFQRDQSALIIWSGCLEDKNLKIDAPVCSVDILPTLSNLFGVEYDSRLTVGRDVFGDREAISIWPDYSWVTELGEMNGSTQKFTPYAGVKVPDGYVDRINAIVRNEINFSRSIQRCGFFIFMNKVLDSRS